jgi:hypothetical protein
MAEPTETRKDLRRALGRQMGMRFYRYTSQEAITSQTDVVIVANFLVQRDDFWNRSWYYELANDETRMIIDSNKVSKNVTLEFTPTGMGTAALFEILDFYSPKMVHEAINEAMRNAWPEFFETKEDFSLCVARDMMEYTFLTTMKPFMVFQVWVERPSSVGRYGVASTGTTTECTLDTTEDISHLTTDYWITFYDGTGKGSARKIATIDNATKKITWVLAIGAAPKADTLVAITNPTKKDEDWYPVHACDFDNKQWPDKMRFKAAYDNQFAGSRIMIRYITVPAELDTDAATTAVPIDFVLSRARAALYDWHKDDSNADRARFDSNFTDQMIKSEAIKAAKAFQAPDQLFWTEDDPALAYANVDGDPLDWAGF